MSTFASELVPKVEVELVLARQPIFDRDLTVWGSEVLFRDQAGARYGGDAMTAEVLLRAGLDIGIENLVGNEKACLNVTRAYDLLHRTQDIVKENCSRCPQFDRSVGNFPLADGPVPTRWLALSRSRPDPPGGLVGGSSRVR